MTPNLYVCTIRCRPEVVHDVISGRNVKTIDGYQVVNLTSLALIVSEILKNHFVTTTEAAADTDYII